MTIVPHNCYATRRPFPILLQIVCFCLMLLYGLLFLILLVNGKHDLPNIPLVAQTPVGTPFNFNGTTMTSIGLCDTNGQDWFYVERLDLVRNIRTISTSSCPNHFSACQYANCDVNVSVSLKRNRTIEIPLYPQFAKRPRDVTCSYEDVGIALNGVPLRSIQSSPRSERCVPPRRAVLPSERKANGNVSWVFSVLGVGEVKVCDLSGIGDAVRECGDVVPSEGIFYDKCGGRADEYGAYHYKVVPPCLLQQLEMASPKDSVLGEMAFPVKPVELGRHSPQIGWALDGFPVYGPRGPHGTLMERCSPFSGKSENGKRDRPPSSLDFSQDDFDAGFGGDGVVCLDRCNGFKAELPQVDGYAYRYYMSGEAGSGHCSDEVINSGTCSFVAGDKCCLDTIPSRRYAPYTIACLMGCELTETCELSGIAGTAYNFYPKKANYPTTVYVSSPISPPIPSSVSVVPSNPLYTPPQTLPVASSDLLRALAQQQDNSRSLLGVEKTIFRYANRSLGILIYDSSKRLADEDVLDSFEVLVSAPTFTSSLDGSTSNVADINTNSSYRADDVILQPLPSTDDDVFIHDMAFHAGHVYLALHNKISLMSTASSSDVKTTTPIITSLLFVTIHGYNLGTGPDDVVSVAMRGYHSTTVRWISSRVVKAIFTNIPAADVSSSDEEGLFVKTVGGEMQGVHLQPLTIVRSKSGRPVIESVTIVPKPLSPHAIACQSSSTFLSSADELLLTLEDDSSPDSVALSWLYWSNVAPAFAGLFRSRLDGSQLEPLLLNRERIHSILVLPLDVDRDMLLFTDALRGRLSVVTVPSSGNVNFAFDADTPGAIDLPIPQDQNELTLLAGLQEPSAITKDVSNGFIYVATLEGTLLQLDLAFVQDSIRKESSVHERLSEPPLSKEPMSSSLFTFGVRMPQPHWIRVISVGLPSTSRITGISILPELRTMLAPDAPCPSFELEPWNERRIFLIDASSNSVHLVSTHGVGTVSLYIGGSSTVPLVVWPMALLATYDRATMQEFLNASCARKSYRNPIFEVRLYIAEFLGKLWQLELTFPTPPISERNLNLLRSDPVPLLDMSSFTASNDIRAFFELSRLGNNNATLQAIMQASLIPDNYARGSRKIMDMQSPIRFEAYS